MTASPAEIMLLGKLNYVISKLLRDLRKYQGAALVVLTILLLWEATALYQENVLNWLWRIFSLSPPVPDLRFLSSPIEVIKDIPSELRGGALLMSLWQTTGHCLTAFLIAWTSGLLLSRLLSSSERWQRALLPLVHGLSGVPPVAILPLLLVAFRLGAASVVALAVFGAMISVTLICYEEQSRVTRDFKLMISHLGYTRLGVWLWELSTISGGLHTAARECLRWGLILVVVGEMHGSVAGGMGAYIDSARLDQRYSAVYLGIIGCALLSVLLKVTLDLSAELVHTIIKRVMLGGRVPLRALRNVFGDEG